MYTHTHTKVQNSGGLFRMDGDVWVEMYMDTHTHTHTYIYIYVYLDQNSLSALYIFLSVIFIYCGNERNIVKSLSIIQLQ